LSAHRESDVAISELGAWIEKTPDRPDLRLSRGGHYFDRERWVECEADLIVVAQRDPAFPGLDLAFARLYLATARLNEARTRLDRALRHHPNDPTALILRSRARAQSDDPTGAASDLTAAIEVLPEPRPEHFLERAALPLPPTEALRGMLEGIRRIGPALALMERALALEIQLGKTDDALARLATLRETASRKEFWWKRTGDVLAGTGRHTEALAAYNRARTALAQQPDWLRGTPDALTLASELSNVTSQ